MNNIVTKILVAVILVASIWQLDILVHKFKPLAANVSKDVTETPTGESNTVLTYTAKEDTTAAQEILLQPEKIVIEKIKVDLPVVAMPLKDGTWEVQPHVANYAIGTSLINDKSGNVGIYAHARSDAFANIKDLIAGDKIAIYSGEYVAIYQVSSSTTVKPEVVDVFYPTPDPTLTLITCDGVYSEKRYVVVSKLINISTYEK